eukprot:gene8444-10226_t
MAETFVEERELSSVLALLDKFVPVIPDEVVKHCLESAGLETNDGDVIRLVSLATQKFVSDVAKDAYRFHQQSRKDSKKKASTRDQEHTLTMEDLSYALREHNITAINPQYYL